MSDDWRERWRREREADAKNATKSYTLAPEFVETWRGGHYDAHFCKCSRCIDTRLKAIERTKRGGPRR